MMKKKATLIEFLWIWDKCQDLTIPHHHKTICRFLSNVWYSKQRQGLLMAFRNSGKSTLVGLFCAWALYQKNETRILIMSADYELAKKMVRNIKRIIEKHPLTQGLKPSQKDQWSADRFTILRKTELRDPSVLARGIGANITGCRADLIVCDDVEVPKNCDTAYKREELKERLTELDFVLVPSGMSLFVGTPHTKETIYDISASGFLKDFQLLKLPILDEKGQSAWPERFSLEKIEEIKKRAGPYKFLSQMLLRPVAPNKSRLNTQLVKFYASELEYHQANNSSRLSLCGEKIVSAIAWWDPAFGKVQGDRSVLACVYFDGLGNSYVHDMIYLNVKDEDNATSEQCNRVVDAIEKYHLPCVMIETNGIGKFLPELLKKTLAERKVSCSVIAKISHTPKQQRILEALDARLANGSIWLHNRVSQTPFMAEMEEWSEANKNGHDDGLDALAGCLLAEPVRLDYRSMLKTSAHFQRNISVFNLEEVKV